MPKDNPEAYRQIDEFIAGLSQDELKYASGAVAAAMEKTGDSEEEMGEGEKPMMDGESSPPSDENYDFEEISK